MYWRTKKYARNAVQRTMYSILLPLFRYVTGFFAYEIQALWPTAPTPFFIHLSMLCVPNQKQKGMAIRLNLGK